MFSKFISNITKNIGGGLLGQVNNLSPSQIGQNLMNAPNAYMENLQLRLEKFRKLFDDPKEYEKFLMKNHPELMRLELLNLKKQEKASRFSPQTMPSLPPLPPDNRRIDPAYLNSAQIYLR